MLFGGVFPDGESAFSFPILCRVILVGLTLDAALVVPNVVCHVHL